MSIFAVQDTLSILNNIVCRYSPSAISGIGKALPSDNTALAAWLDISGQRSNLEQSTGTNQPLFKTAGISSRPSVLFDGSNDLIQTVTTSPLLNNIFNGGGFVFGVVNLNSAGGNSAGRLFSQSGGNCFLQFTSGNTGFLKVGLSRSFSTTSGSWETSSTTALQLGTTAIVGVSYDSSNVANDPEIYVNSLTPLAITETSTPVGTATSATTITIGNSSISNRALDGNLGQIVFGKGLTAATRSQIMTAMANYYGVALV